MEPVLSGISRRDTFKTLGTAATVAVLSSRTLGEEAPRKLKGRIKQGCTRHMMRRLSTEEACRTAKELGLVGFDFAKSSEWPVLKEHGLAATMAPGAGGIRQGLNDRSRHADYLASFKKNIAAAAKHGWRNVITMAGDRKGISDEEGMTNCVPILKEAVKIAADHNVIICMELLNSKVNHPGYMCDKSAWGFELCRRVDSPNFKLLFDIYHMQIMEGDIIRTITGNIDHIGHFHTAGNPGRRDLDEDQELYYPAVMRAIAKLTDEGKYDGYVVHEFGPKKGVESIRAAVQLCDV